MIPEFFNHFSKTFIFVSLVIFFTTIIYKLNKRNQDRKTAELRERFVKTGWSSPIINLGLFLGIVTLTFGAWNLYPLIIEGRLNLDLLTIISSGMFLLGIMTLWITPFINVNSEFVTTSPLLLRLFGLTFATKRILLSDISNVSKANSGWTHMYPLVFAITIFTKDNKKTVIHTEFFDWEVGNALFEHLGVKN